MEENTVVTTPQETGIDTNVGTIETTNNDTQQTTQQTTTEQSTPQAFKVKYLHEEKEVPYDEAPTYIQKGMDYDRVKGKYEETKPVLSFVEELAQESGMSVQEYLQAAREYREAEKIRALAEKEGISEELAQRLTKLERNEQDRQHQEHQRQQEARKNQEYNEFFTYFESENGRSFDGTKDAIPDEVWQGVAKGKTLLDSYQSYEARMLKDKVKELESKLQTQQTNVSNNATSTGSVTGNGAITADFISQELFNNNKHDREWVVKNFERINQSRKSWSS